MSTNSTLNDLFREVIFQNECAGNLRFVCKFSDPDGVRSGKSGWSFGICQFDTKNNSQALECLRECGFTEAEISGIVNQTIDVVVLSPRLTRAKDVIAKYDAAQLTGCLNAALNVVTSQGIPAENPGGILALADYINQYGSIGPQFIAWMKNLKGTITAKDVLKFKLGFTKYGKEHPGDCTRRFNNIMAILAKEEGK